MYTVKPQKNVVKLSRDPGTDNNDDTADDSPVSTGLKNIWLHLPTG